MATDESRVDASLSADPATEDPPEATFVVAGRLLIDPESPPDRGWLRIERGRIAAIGDGDPPCGLSAPELLGGDGRLVVPGFIDAHVHLPQVRAIGCVRTDLLAWLDEVIFPLEMTWAAEHVVRSDLALFHRRLLDSGTLGAAALSSPHAAALPIVLRRAGLPPLRLMVGQALMDRGGPPALVGERPWDPDSAPASEWAPRMEVSLNPRFALSCSAALLDEAARLAGDRRFIHTHLAESESECAAVRQLFPDDASYADLYDHHALLSPRTLLAHGVHLAPEEWETIARRGSVVVHCPQANTFLRSGLFDLGAARDHAIRLALGSDVAAGSDLAMPRVARSMIEVATLRSITLDRAAPIPTPAEAWNLITRGNADALGWHDMGRIDVGASADLLVLRPDFEIDRGDRREVSDVIGRLLFGWRDEWIERSIVAGVPMPSGGA
ncbi:MAG TPA: amidohydrolase family protein [Phycisphaerales bacterium]|nr:amidohydrolase family protein [Phycisphaerales bacterium]HMP38305.1 amidohydrolase family protein [Phycisphaerales bacterium]